MIGLTLEEKESKNLSAVYYGPYPTRLAARKALDEVTAAQTQRVVHRTIFNINTPV